MATMCPDEGLDFILGQFPFNTAKYTSPAEPRPVHVADGVDGDHPRADDREHHRNHLHLLRPPVVGGRDVGGRGRAADEPGRQQTYPQVTFPTVGATGATINGFYITNNGHTICIGQANFDDVTAVVLATNDVIKVTPTFAYLH